MVSCEIRIQHHHFQFFSAPQSATSCHWEVILVTTLKSPSSWTIFFTLFLQQKQGPSPKAQQPPRAALCDLMLPPTGCGATQSSWALSLLWVLVWIPIQPCCCTGGTVLGQEGPQPHGLHEQSWGSALFQALVLCSCSWTGLWALPGTCSVSGTASQAGRGVHTVTAENSAHTHCTQNWNLNHAVHRTTHVYRTPTESHWCQSKKAYEWTVQLCEACFPLDFNWVPLSASPISSLC